MIDSYFSLMRSFIEQKKNDIDDEEIKQNFDSISGTYFSPNVVVDLKTFGDMASLTKIFDTPSYLNHIARALLEFESKDQPAEIFFQEFEKALTTSFYRANHPSLNLNKDITRQNLLSILLLLSAMLFMDVLLLLPGTMVEISLVLTGIITCCIIYSLYVFNASTNECTKNELKEDDIVTAQYMFISNATFMASIFPTVIALGVAHFISINVIWAFVAIVVATVLQCIFLLTSIISGFFGIKRKFEQDEKKSKWNSAVWCVCCLLLMGFSCYANFVLNLGLIITNLNTNILFSSLMTGIGICVSAISCSLYSHYHSCANGNRFS